MADDLKVSALVATPNGDLEINDGDFYRLGPNTKAQVQVQWRRQTITSPYVPGTFTVNAVQDSITETVEVYVRGHDSGDMRLRLKRLTDAFSQFNYTITWNFEDDRYVWQCDLADYSIDIRREFRHARMALASFQVPRYPSLLRA